MVLHLRLEDRNVGDGERVSWGGANTKGKGGDCKLTKNMFLHNNLVNLCLKKNTTSLSSSLTQLYFMIIKSCCEVMG